ncbi:MAG TPA: putative Ig domain-containing protein [Dehalococcoidia bacterium]|nr:putative Ig domain-containing protein [Dehalococcoidia bacterium]
MRRVMLMVALASAMAFLGTGAVRTEAAPPFHCNQVNMHPNGLPNGQVGFAYSSTLSLTPASNLLPASVTNAPLLPPGLSFTPGPSSNQVTLSGTATVAGTYTFTVELGATYVYGTICKVSQTYTVTIAP